jgi:DNA-binding MarR family transcriptional regulator
MAKGQVKIFRPDRYLEAVRGLGPIDTGSLNQRLADEWGVKAWAIRRLGRLAQERHLIQFDRDPNDGRKFLVSLAPRGKERLRFKAEHPRQVGPAGWWWMDSRTGREPSTGELAADPLPDSDRPERPPQEWIDEAFTVSPDSYPAFTASDWRRVEAEDWLERWSPEEAAKLKRERGWRLPRRNLGPPRPTASSEADGFAQAVRRARARRPRTMPESVDQ